MDKATTIEEYGWGASYENFDREKFAELIVRECARLCSDPVVVLQHWSLDSKPE
jgi:hypothetical protein